MQGMLVRRGTPIVTVSEFSRQEIIRHLGARDAQVQVMPEGADHVARILAAPEILALHGLRAGRYVLAVGTLAAHKNLRALGALAEALAAREVPLVIAGSLGGAAFGDGQALALPQPARYIGRVSDGALKALYEQAGCFVFPSRYEGFGLPVVEAMASGCPVVASGIPVLREICGPAGQFCDPLAPPDIAAKVLEVLDDADLAARLRAAGLARTRMLTWDAAAARLLDIIETVDRGGR
jgi:glycosyltransferase involved in cell wall biosynthesis